MDLAYAISGWMAFVAFVSLVVMLSAAFTFDSLIKPIEGKLANTLLDTLFINLLLFLVIGLGALGTTGIIDYFG